MMVQHSINPKARLTAKIFLAALLLLPGSLLPGCVSSTQNHGHVPFAEKEPQLKVGMSDKDDVLRILGTPSVRSEFAPEVWYYISSRHKTRAFLPSKRVEQYVLAVHFNDVGKVDALEHFTGEDMAKITPEKEVTPTEGDTLGVMEQLIGNIGRFNRQVDADQ